MLYRPENSSSDKGQLQRTNTIRLKSFSGNDWHAISIDNKTCDCKNKIQECPIDLKGTSSAGRDQFRAHRSLGICSK